MSEEAPGQIEVAAPKGWRLLEDQEVLKEGDYVGFTTGEWCKASEMDIGYSMENSCWWHGIRKVENKPNDYNQQIMEDQDRRNTLIPETKPPKAWRWLGRELYHEWANNTNIGYERIPSWIELSEEQKIKWNDKADLLNRQTTQP